MANIFGFLNEGYLSNQFSDYKDRYPTGRFSNVNQTGISNPFASLDLNNGGVFNYQEVDREYTKPKTNAILANVPFEGLIESVGDLLASPFTHKGTSLSDWVHSTKDRVTNQKVRNYSDYKKIQHKWGNY